MKKKINGLFVLLGYIAIIVQLFNLETPIQTIKIAGFSIKYILFYGFIFISIIRWICQPFFNRKKRKVKYTDFLIFLYIAGPYVIGLLRGWGGYNVLIESTLMIMPIAVYAWCESNDFDIKKYLIIFFTTVIIASIISILVAMRIISTNIWAAQNDFVRSAGAVDSTLFVGGYIASYILLFVYPENITKRQRIFLISAYGASISGLLFTQSRTRIVLVLFMTALLLFYNIFNKKSKKGNLRFFALVFVVGLIILIYNPQIIFQISNQVLARFDTIADVNVTFRATESSLQFSEFLKAPILGMGWGSRSQFSNMYVHNIFTAILMQGGLTFGICIAIWYLSFVSRMLKAKYNMHTPYYIISMFFWLCLLVLGYTNAGFLQSGGYFMMVFVYMYNKNAFPRMSKR